MNKWKHKYNLTKNEYTNKNSLILLLYACVISTKNTIWEKKQYSKNFSIVTWPKFNLRNKHSFFLIYPTFFPVLSGIQNSWASGNEPINKRKVTITLILITVPREPVYVYLLNEVLLRWECIKVRYVCQVSHFNEDEKILLIFLAFHLSTLTPKFDENSRFLWSIILSRTGTKM